ncbi:hypothetical protein WJX77_005807 [Trebouxia sp. C0004]
MSFPALEQRPQCHCKHGGPTKPFNTVRPCSSRHKDRLVKCHAAINNVRVTTFRDGSVTYHFSEPAEFTQQQPETNLQPTHSVQTDSYGLNGVPSKAPAKQHVSTVLASFRASSAVAGQTRTQQATLQEARPTGQAQKTPSWARKLEWNKQVRIIPKNGLGTQTRNDNKQRQTPSLHSPAEQDLHSAEQPSNLDNQLDFDNADIQLLLRAYSSRAAAGRLDAALEVLEGVVAAGRIDVLCKVRHKDFLRPAADHKAVNHAMRFVKLLPSHMTDARTYNMLVSVCIAARDLPMALQAGMMLRNTGRRLDTFLYTSLITACAMEGDTDMAFRLYEDMQADRVGTDPCVYTALISTCSRKIQMSDVEGRRSQLVLLERAFGVFYDMQEVKVRPDAAVWNALIAAAGRAGQLQRAFEALQDMQDHFQQPDEHTFTSLIDACRRAEEQNLALKVYHNALSSGCTHSMLLYAAAIAACQHPVDLDTAMEIYGEMQAYDVQPDGQLYSSLMDVAGQAKRVDLAFDLQADMVAQGLQPSKATYSALIMVCINNEQLERAGEVYQLTVKSGLHPDIHAYNALINAYGCDFQFGKAVSLTEGMVKSGTKPDQFTFTAIVAACQRANEAEVAFEVFRLMRQKKIVLDGTLCFILLRLCYNRLREEWYPGGYPPRADGQPMQHMPGETSPAGRRLLQVLSGKTDVLDTPENVNWVSRAMLVYRQAVSQGLRPSLKALDRLLACLRLPYIPPLPSDGTSTSVLSTFKGAYVSPGHTQLAELAQQQANDIAFDPSAISILDEAVTLGVLPPFKLDIPCAVDMRQMPPSVAEVYVLSMVASLKRISQNKAHTAAPQPITFLVQPYDTAQVYFPSYAQDAFSPTDRGQGQQSVSSHDEEEEALLDQLRSNSLLIPSLYPSSSSSADSNQQTSSSSDNTALGVVGMLRRLRLWTEEDARNGKLTVLPKSITEWLRSTDKAAANIRSQSPMHQQQWIGKSIASQQRQLRSGSASRPFNRNVYSHRGRHQQGRGRPQNRPDPIVWNDVQAHTRK